MTIFADVATQWQIADNAFSVLVQQAFSTNDDALFDAAFEQKQRNDQAYFLYLFTRFEDAVNQAITVILGNHVPGISWSDRRIWEAWSKPGVEDITFMSKVEVLTDKSRQDYATIKEYYDGRNDVAHGGIWSEQFFIPAIAQTMDRICATFPTS